jgi:hypothetical protein
MYNILGGGGGSGPYRVKKAMNQKSSERKETFISFLSKIS